MTTCPLCGKTTPSSGEENPACRRCPLVRGGCQLSRCPRCGYEWAEGSRVLAWLKRSLDGWRSTASDAAARP